MEILVEVACYDLRYYSWLLSATGLVWASGSEGKNYSPRTSLIQQILGDTRHRSTDGGRPRFPHLGTPDSSLGDGVYSPRTLAQPKPDGRGQRGHRGLRGHVVPAPFPSALSEPLGPVGRPLPMCCVSNCTAGISLRGMWPVPPSLQQRRQHHADAAMAQLHSPAAPPAPECFWVAGGSQPAQRHRGREAKPRLRRGPPGKKRGPPEGAGRCREVGGARGQLD